MKKANKLTGEMVLRPEMIERVTKMLGHPPVWVRKHTSMTCGYKVRSTIYHYLLAWKYVGQDRGTDPVRARYFEVYGLREDDLAWVTDGEKPVYNFKSTGAHFRPCEAVPWSLIRMEAVSCIRSPKVVPK